MATSLYHDLSSFIDHSADPRTAEWPLVGSPVPLLIIIISYLYFVLKCGPDYMKERKPYDLKTIITVYNVGQVLACAYLFYAILNCGWLDEYSLGCQPVDYSDNPRALRLANLVWWVMLLKLSEFVETVFFVLRKKQNQVSNLHLYHHVSTLTVGWMCTKYTPGGMATFSILPNCLVHVLMYSYYLVALHASKETQKKLQKWKPKLTMIQMIQFTIVILHSFSALRTDCHVPKFMAYVFIPNVFIVYYLFYNFYRRSYIKKLD